MIARNSRLIVASTCADRKAAIATERVSLRDVPHGPARQRAISWAARLKRAGGGRESADFLYQGDHWNATKATLHNASEAGFRAELWIVSAGYGLYPAHSPVGSYAATFTPGHEDSVAPPDIDRVSRLHYLARWWDAIADRLPVDGVRTRTFSRIASRYRDAGILVISGGSYLDAITEDLLEAAERLDDPDQLVIVSCGAAARTSHSLQNHLLPVDARFQQVVGGTRSALNARVAKWLLGQIPYGGNFGFAALRARIEKTAEGLEDAPRYDRQPMTDAEVKRWIRKAGREVERPSASALLRLFRDSGFACEQKRFGRLFRDAAGAGRRAR